VTEEREHAKFKVSKSSQQPDLESLMFEAQKQHTGCARAQKDRLSKVKYLLEGSLMQEKFVITGLLLCWIDFFG
jgi:hypothetical protein